MSETRQIRFCGPEWEDTGLVDVGFATFVPGESSDVEPFANGSCARRGCGNPPRSNRKHGVFCSDVCRAFATRHPEDDLRKRRGCLVQRLTQKDEMLRLNHNAEKVLARLMLGPATGMDLLRAGGGIRYGARIKELRDRGHRIDKKHLGEGVWKYTLVT